VIRLLDAARDNRGQPQEVLSVPSIHVGPRRVRCLRMLRSVLRVSAAVSGSSAARCGELPELLWLDYESRWREFELGLVAAERVLKNPMAAWGRALVFC
jgi:hypothetical protein